MHDGEPGPPPPPPGGGAGEQEDYTESDDEGADGYRKGGYHVVTIGEVYNGRYRVIAKLGWGHFSTVWLCVDMNTSKHVAMKVQKSAPHYTEAAFDEIELLNKAAKRSEDPEWTASLHGPLAELVPGVPFTGVVQLCDYFEHYGPNGQHVCMVFETMGPNVLALIKRFNFKGVPLEIVRKVACHTLVGLDYLHRVCGIIHTDLKPENVLVGCPRGVPVDKKGVPLVGQVDPALVAAKHAQAAMSQKLVDKEAGKQKKKGFKKKQKSDGPGTEEKEEEEVCGHADVQPEKGESDEQSS
jgi:serine/threonine protein kinase